jgi:hypothetical protein
MPRRRRYATRTELIGLIAGRVPDTEPAAIERFVDGLTELGVQVDQLVKVVVDERI